MMDDDQIAALAKGMVPFVRQCVAEAVVKAAVLPPELAEQVASAVRLLHESPALEPRKETARPAPRVSRIERDDDGNFVPIYDGDPKS
jgi:hypothetical protein